MLANRSKTHCQNVVPAGGSDTGSDSGPGRNLEAGRVVCCKLFPPSRFGAARVCLQTLANVQRAGGDRIRVRIRFLTLWSVGPRHACLHISQGSTLATRRPPDLH